MPLPKWVKAKFAIRVITATSQYCQAPQPGAVTSPAPPILVRATGYREIPIQSTTVPLTKGGKYGSMYFRVKANIKDAIAPISWAPRIIATIPAPPTSWNWLARANIVGRYAKLTP